MKKTIKPQFLPRPTCCDECKSYSIELVEKKEIYGPFADGEGQLWLCRDCGAYVPCHEGTDRPAGAMGNEATRRARTRAHAAFDPLWRSKHQGHDRKWWQTWLVGLLELPPERCNIAMLDREQCERVIKACRAEWGDGRKAV